MKNAEGVGQVLSLAGWLAIAFVVAAIGSVASINAVDFYGQLHQPAWAPPAWVFGPVWTFLFVLIGVAGWLVWRVRPRLRVTPAVWVYGLQLAANALWSWLFFGWHLGAAASVEVVLLWGLIGWNIVCFWPLQRLAALLLVPYFAWVSFAVVLTWWIWLHNPQVL